MHNAVLALIGQIISIVVVSRLLGLVLRRFDQPLVIAEIAAGIVLGPSVLGRIWPDATATLFAPSGMGTLNMASQLGLIFFMFLVGLELDFSLLRGRGRTTVAISHTSILVPFGLGAVLALALYPHNAGPGVAFVPFALFIGAAMSITAFPVLARILTDRGLLGTPVGAAAMACAAVDDVTAWCMLAFVIAIAQAKGVGSAVVVTLQALAYVAFMVWLVRPALKRVFARATNGSGVTQDSVAVVAVVLLLSSAATEWIGIHALFGAFMAGAVMPRQGALSAALPGRLKDFVVVVLLPLFFAYSGVRTQIGLLDTPAAWLMCAAIIAVACLGKFGGTAVAARITGMSWRESGALGILTNTRGLMELIVLNIGLDLGVITPLLFTSMVIMALVTTFMSTPLLKRLYSAEDFVRQPQGSTALQS